MSIVESEPLDSSMIPNPTSYSVNLWTIESSFFYYNVPVLSGR